MYDPIRQHCDLLDPTGWSCVTPADFDYPPSLASRVWAQLKRIARWVYTPCCTYEEPGA